MVELKKVTIDDFEMVYPLLLDFGKPDTSENRDIWKQLFINQWETDEDYTGYMLVDDNKAVGYMGYIFSRRKINSKTEKFCNMSGWIVKKDYRKEYKMLLYEPAMELKDYTLTALFSTKAAHVLERRLGFKELDDCYYYIPANINPLLLLFKRKIRIINDLNYIIKYVDDISSKIIEDHLKFKNLNHLLVETNEGNIYLTIKQLVRKRYLSFAEIYYISDKKLFKKYFDQIRYHLLTDLKYVGIVIDSRFIKGMNISLKYKVNYFVSNQYMSDHLEPEDVDYLYTERVIFY
ncbi:MAG: hypothetical protein Q8880_05430 [Bacteroidota bacterium]|nr:hypothetical protein [Bacteroidota bacterium]